jgi:apolipoprotein N-acyltransferase
VRALTFTLASALLRGFAQPGWLGGMGWPLLLLAVPLRILGWNESARRPWLNDLLHGLVFWMVAFSFLGHLHPIAVLSAALMMSLMGPVEGWLARRLRRRLPAAAAGALALATAGWLQMEFFLIGAGGVPWASWAWPLSNSPLLPLASALGEAGLIALVTACGGAIAALWLRQRRDPSWIAALGLAAFGGIFMTPAPVSTGLLPCLAVQGCIRVEEKARAHLDPVAFFRRQVEVTRSALEPDGPGRLVLWAETMWPFPVVVPDAPAGLVRQWFPRHGFEEIASAEIVEDQARLVRFVLADAPPSSTFATGSHLYQALPSDAGPEDLSPRSSETVIYNAEGQLLAHLPKSELVPFGERLPLWGKFPFARSLATAIQSGSGLRPDFVRPPGSGPIHAAGLPALGFATCWENVFPGVFRLQALRGAEAFIILSNEDWYGDGSREMEQMLAATRLRAVETRRSVLRVTNTGHTGLFSPDGSFLPGPAIGVPEAWPVDLPLVAPDTRTGYLRIGRWILPLIAALGAVLALAPGPGRNRGMVEPSKG